MNDVHILIVFDMMGTMECVAKEARQKEEIFSQDYVAKLFPFSSIKTNLKLRLVKLFNPVTQGD